MSERFAGQAGVYWVDHYVVPTNDLLRWKQFYEDVLGGHVHGYGGLTTGEKRRRAPIRCFVSMGRYHHNGGFLQNEILPPSEGLGRGLPRYGYFVRREDLDAHLRRLERCGVPHTEPARTSADGEPGTVVYFEDPDHNQYEFWAPDRMPDGAMENDNPAGIGRISSVLQETRDLGATSDFYERFCGMIPVRSDDVARDTLVFGLLGGGRLVFKQRAALGSRAGGQGQWLGKHSALTVSNDQFLGLYQKLWGALPESEYRPFSSEDCPFDYTSQPAHTELHGLAARGEQHTAGAIVPRGTFFYDADANPYHYVGGVAVGRSMAHYGRGYSGDALALTPEVRSALEGLGAPAPR